MFIIAVLLVAFFVLVFGSIAASLLDQCPGWLTELLLALMVSTGLFTVALIVAISTTQPVIH